MNSSDDSEGDCCDGSEGDCCDDMEGDCCGCQIGCNNAGWVKIWAEDGLILLGRVLTVFVIAVRKVEVICIDGKLSTCIILALFL